MSKAAELKTRRRPPRVMVLPPSCFTDAWSSKPTTPLQAGLRRPSAGESEFATKTAVEVVDKLFPGMSHHDPVWKQAYDIALLHVLISYTLTRPDDVDQPLWPRVQSDGDNWVTKLNTAEGLTAARNPTGLVVSRIFTVDGIGRLYDEMHILALENNPLYPELDNGEIAKFFRRLPVELAELEAHAAPGEREAQVDVRHATATEIRRMLGYLSSLMETGMTRPPQPLPKKESPPRG